MGYYFPICSEICILVKKALKSDTTLTAVPFFSKFFEIHLILPLHQPRVEVGIAVLIPLAPFVGQAMFCNKKGLMIGALDPTFDTTFHVDGWGNTVILLLESFADADKPIKESAIPENPQSVLDWLSECWNPHENVFSPGQYTLKLANIGPNFVSWRWMSRRERRKM